MPEIMTPERAEQARRYHAIGYRLMLARMGLFALFIAALVLGGANALWALVPNPVLFILALFLLQFLVGLPLRYAGLQVSRRFGISVQSTASWISDLIKSLTINTILNGAIALLILWLWQRLPATWHLWTAAVVVLGNLLLTYVAPVWIMPLFHKYTPLEDGELKDRLLDLSHRAGVAVRGVFVEDSSAKVTALNAALTGVGSTRRIILYDTLIQSCSVDEIEVVLAHEMGHHVYDHILKITLASTGFLALVFLTAGYALAPLSESLGLGGLQPPALPLLMLLFIVIGLPLMPPLMALMRQWERDCDAFALKLTGNRSAFITVFQKLADKNLADLSPPRWYYWFLTSHPPVPERIGMAERWT